MRRSVWLSFAGPVLTVGLLAAQTPGSTPSAAETILAKDFVRHLGVMAADSMLGRGTPSRGLTLTAQYVADQFQAFGLAPLGDGGTWFQRFTVGSDTLTAPNTVGVLEGTDPKLKDEYIVFVAHMDHVGFHSGGDGSDSIYNGANDNASGTAGLVELAEAFTRPGARPRRSLIFVAVGGEEAGLLGSRYFVEHPPVPIDRFAAAINLDMIAGRRGDTVSVHGGLDSHLGAIVDRMASAHPDLRMAVSLEEGKSGGSDHESFRDKGVPFLFFHTAVREYPHWHGADDELEMIDAELAARVLRLVFYVSHDAANADARPPRNAADSSEP